MAHHRGIPGKVCGCFLPFNSSPWVMLWIVYWAHKSGPPQAPFTLGTGRGGGRICEHGQGASADHRLSPVPLACLPHPGKD